MAPRYPFGAISGLVLDPRDEALRDQPGLCRIQMPWGGEAWLATRYHDVRMVLSDLRFSRAQAAGRDDVARARPTVDDPRMLIATDPPNHTRLRRLVATAFTPRRVEQMRPRIQQILDHLLDDLLAAGPPADLALRFAWPLPMIVISELLGVPSDDRDAFRVWTEQTLALGTGDTPLSRDQVTAARDRLNSYLADLIAQRRRQPTGDLLSGLVDARDNGDRLSEDELVRLGVTLLISGHETTANQIGNFAMMLMADDRSGWRQLVADPTLISAAVEELLRYVPLAACPDFARIALVDVEVGGQMVRAGEAVLVHMATANRDGDVFAHGHELNFTRDHNPHVAFGHGVHHCLGAPLARMELQLALSGLVTRIPGLRLDVPAEKVPWRADQLVRGVDELPVTW